MKPIGILYDNISQNIGDLAIGISVRQMLLDSGYQNSQIVDLVPGLSNPSDFHQIIIGGGLLLRQKGDFFYDKFRLDGNYILNSMGILGHPTDLSYLNKYSYLSVRSYIDKSKLNYLAKPVEVTPCTTLLLKDSQLDLNIQQPSIGFHFFERHNYDYIIDFINKYSKDFHIYLLPITHYNYDFEYQQRIFAKVDQSKVHLLPQLTPQETFTLIGKFNYFISHSLHGALFAYKHNVPFILLNNLHDSKMSAFMIDRGLDQYLFNDASQIAPKFNQLLTQSPNYEALLKKDLLTLKTHQQKIKNIIESPSSEYTGINLKKLQSRHLHLQKQNQTLKLQIKRIKTSIFYKANLILHQIKK